MPFTIIRGQITEMKVDAIVNAANSQLQEGGGVCGAIFNAAGSHRLQAVCDAIGSCPTGQAVITEGFDLPAKYIIHAVGPRWNGGNDGEAELLRNCYLNSLRLTEEYAIKSIAFPLISSGIYGFPKDKALRIAAGAITDYVLEHNIQVYLIIFDSASFHISQRLFTDVKAYIDDNYVEEHTFARKSFEQNGNLSSESAPRLPPDDNSPLITPHQAFPKQLKKRTDSMLVGSGSADLAKEKGSMEHSLDQVLGNLDESFSESLLRLIDEKGKTDVETYKRANIDRKLFSKIRSHHDYAPKKSTAIALAIGLGLDLNETRELLSKAGYALSKSSKFDLIIRYFIEQKNYDIFEINEVLFAFDQPLLGA